MYSGGRPDRHHAHPYVRVPDLAGGVPVHVPHAIASQPALGCWLAKLTGTECPLQHTCDNTFTSTIHNRNVQYICLPHYITHTGLYLVGLKCRLPMKEPEEVANE